MRDAQGRPAGGSASPSDDAASPRRPLHDAETLAFYEAQATAYAARRADEPSRHLADLLALLPPGARILELGCGGGQDVAAMLASGFDVDATDGSAALAAEAARRLGRPVRTMRFDALDAQAAYDAVWANACLLHVPRIGLPDVLARIRRALRPGGLFFASFKATGQEGRDRFGRLFNQLTATELREAYAAAGDWEVVAVEEGLGGGYDGVEVPWVAVTARRPD